MLAKLAFLQNHIVQRLNSPTRGYHLRIHNNLRHLYKHIRKGDVVLVEGRTELSRAIKLFSNSHWSHIALYVGDELIRKGSPHRERYLREFGEDAKHLLIEAFTGKGVVAAPVRNYCEHNMRVCRPYGIDRKDLRAVVAEVISNLGRRYDEQNILDIALMLLPSWLNFFKKRSITACLGSCSDFRVICSGMIARAFQNVGYPVVPGLEPQSENDSNSDRNPYGATLVMRHYSQILPRDFDLSPNFKIIKFNIIENGRFEYKKLPWEEAEGDSPAGNGAEDPAAESD